MSEASTRIAIVGTLGDLGRKNKLPNKSIAIVDGEKVNEMINFLCSSVNHPDVIWNVESIVLL